MTPSDEPYFPYPPDPARRFGYLIGDLISVGIILMIVIAILKF
jgi:hypothetical protein